MSGIEVQVLNNNVTAALAKFKQKINKSGLLAELREREHYLKPSVVKRNKSAQARRNQQKLAKNQAAAFRDK